MIVARVVPLRRFTTAHQWFDYLVPDGRTVRPGHLVDVPFLRQRVRGVVWDLAPTTTLQRLKPIGPLVTPDPVMTTPQRDICQAIAQQGFVSLGHILLSTIPLYPKTPRPTPLSPPQTAVKTIDTVVPAGSTWWYRRRQEAIAWIIAWLLEPTPTIRVVLVPTVDDGRAVQRAAALRGVDTPVVTSTIGRVAYRRLYDHVRTGQVRRLIGTARVLTLPYPTMPEWLIDQEEHVNHKQTEQNPRLDGRSVLAGLRLKPRVTTPAPSVQWFARHSPPPPPALPRCQRLLVSLGRALDVPWLTPEAEDVLSAAVHQRRQAVLIVPHHGYASALVCRTCGFVVECPYCHQQVRLFRRTDSSAVCRACGRITILPVRCPRCRAVDWRYRGLGLTRMIELLTKRGFTEVADAAGVGAATAAIVVGTYQTYHAFSSWPKLSTIILPSGDGLLSYPDFSVHERAWQYLHRLSSVAPQTRVLVQTWRPEHDFWQDWLHGRDAAWYARELETRRRLGLPPITTQWLAIHPGPQSSAAVNRLQRRLKGLARSGVSWQMLPTPAIGRRAGVSRIVLTARDERWLWSLPLTGLFPYPWQLDTSPMGWFA